VTQAQLEAGLVILTHPLQWESPTTKTTYVPPTERVLYAEVANQGLLLLSMGFLVSPTMSAPQQLAVCGRWHYSLI
jgi:hypothetical protein